MAIYTAVMGNNGDLFVGGSFESRVWNGDDFVDVFHLARFDGKRSRAVCVAASWHVAMNNVVCRCLSVGNSESDVVVPAIDRAIAVHFDTWHYI